MKKSLESRINTGKKFFRVDFVAFNRKRWYNDAMYKHSDARIKANTRYENKAIDKITFRLRKDGGYGITREDVQKAADACGVSVNEYVLQAVKEKMAK